MRHVKRKKNCLNFTQREKLRKYIWKKSIIPKPANPFSMQTINHRVIHLIFFLLPPLFARIMVRQKLAQFNRSEANEFGRNAEREKAGRLIIPILNYGIKRRWLKWALGLWTNFRGKFSRGLFREICLTRGRARTIDERFTVWARWLVTASLAQLVKRSIWSLMARGSNPV